MLKIINKLLNYSVFPLFFKLISLCVLVCLIIIGFKADSSDPVFLKELRNTNLANLFVWSLWWPLIIIFSIFFGRVWCMVCPVETITSLSAKIGFRFKRSKFVLSGWIMLIFYTLLLFIGIEIIEIHRNPTAMSLYLLLIIVASMVIGLFYEKNTFCRYACPVGILLAIYSRLSYIGWRVKDRSVCESCCDKSCIKNRHIYKLNSKSCGVSLYPCEISDNSNCIMCAGCLKTCSEFQSVKSPSRPNPRMEYIGFAKDLFQIRPLSHVELLFLVVVSGFVISELLSECKFTNDILNYFPMLLCKSLHVDNKITSSLIYSFVIFVIYPIIIFSIPFLFSKARKSFTNFNSYLCYFGLSIIPVVAAAHLSKALVKVTSRIPYWEIVTKDFSGTKTAESIIHHKLILSKIPEWVNTFVTFGMFFFIVTGIIIGIMVVSKINKKETKILGSSITFYLLPVLYGSVFLYAIVVWRILNL